MNTFAAIFPLMVLSALTAVYPAISDSPLFEKGRDIRPLLEQNENLRAEALRGQARKSELREKAYLIMRLDEPAEECIVRDPAAKSCLVSVEDFNQTLENWDFGDRDQKPDFPTYEDARRERASLLKNLLDEKYLESYAPDRHSLDSLHRLFDSARIDRVHAFREHQGDSVFRALYAQHFTSLFQGKEIKHYQALATSDSGLADSLRREMEALRKGGMEANDSKRFAPIHPWRPVAEEDLPPQLSSVAKTLRPGEAAGPLQTPYGHVFLRLHSMRRTRDQGFEEALPLLISLMHAPSGQDKRLEASIAAYYSRNAADFMAADTVQYRVWLLPEEKRKTGVHKEERIRNDTAKVNSVTIMDTNLPQPLRDELELYRPVQPGELLGPIHSLFGVWYFQPLNVRKTERILSLAEAAPRIRELLLGKASLSPETFARREAEAKDLDLWKGLVSDYLLRKMGVGLSSAETHQRLEQDKADWMRNRLQIRLVEWVVDEPVSRTNTTEVLERRPQIPLD